MTKFEEHDGLIFKMLEEHEIVPLKENDANVLVRFITHGVIGEYVMEHWLDCNQKNVPIYVENVDSDGDVTVCIENGNEHHCCPFPMFEIIGYPVADGSKEWALYQMMQGKMVCHETSPWDWYRMYSDHAIQNRTVGYMDRVSAWLESTVQSGWQIYTEPKPESENIIHGHIPADMHLKYFHLHEFKVGDWVEFIDVGGHKSQGKYLSNDCDHAIIVLDITCNMRCVVPMTKIIRKLKPSEVVLHFGSGISGTIKRWDSTTFHIFHGNSKFSKIHIDALDAPTRELVEGLLKAQEEEK